MFLCLVARVLSSWGSHADKQPPGVCFGCIRPAPAGELGQLAGSRQPPGHLGPSLRSPLPEQPHPGMRPSLPQLGLASVCSSCLNGQHSIPWELEPWAESQDTWLVTPCVTEASPPPSRRGWTQASLLTSSWLAGRHPPPPPRPRRTGPGGRRRMQARCVRAHPGSQRLPEGPSGPGPSPTTPGPGHLPAALLPAWQPQHSELGVPGQTQDASRSGPSSDGSGRENHVLLSLCVSFCQAVLPGSFLGPRPEIVALIAEP